MPVWGAALLGVVALEAAFPPVEGSALVWLALAPLVLGLWRGPGSAGQWFSMGWGLGALHYAIQLLWLHRTLVVLGGVSWPAYALFHVICAAALGLGWGALLGWARWGWLRWGWWPGFTLPIGLALLEVVLSRQPFGGVVWGSLSVPLAQTLLAHHLAPWVGAPGLVLLLGAGNAAWALAWTRPGRGAPLFLAAALTLVATWPPSTAQSAHDSQVSGGKPPFRVLLVPGNIPQAEMEAHRDSQEIPRRYLAATLATLTTLAPLPGGPPPLVIWPEGAGNGNALKGKVLAELSRTFTLMEADLLLGADAVDRPALYNSLFLLPSGPFDFSRYDKRHLVPFGEYVPQGFRWLFGRKITAGEVDYTSGSRDPVLVWRGVSLGMGVCFESLLPGHIRTAVLGGAQALVITANNAWLDAPGQRQHLLLSLLRALEAGRDMVFVSNGGPSALIRPGMPLQSYPADSKPQTVWVQPRTHLTVYQRWGDWVLLPLVSGMVMVLAWGKKNRAKWL